MSTLTSEMLIEMHRHIERKIAQAFTIPADMLRERPRSSYDEVRERNNLMAVRIVYSPYALEFTSERLFPFSKHRSRRIHKKLVKRFGGEYRMRPVIWHTPGAIIAHPSFREQLEAAMARENAKIKSAAAEAKSRTSDF